MASSLSTRPAVPGREGRTSWSNLAALAVLAALALTDALLLIPFVSGISVRATGLFNEGWNAFHAERAFAAGALYPDPVSLVTNNYPPLSFYLVGGIGRLVGDNIVAGRAVSLLCFVTVAALLGTLVRRRSASSLLGGLAGLSFLGYGLIHNPLYVAANDPQWLGQAAITAALWVFVIGEERPRWRTAALALMITAGLIKHTLLALPLATTLWLIWNDRPALRPWFVTAALGVLGSAAVLYLAFGSNLFYGVLAPRDFRLAYVWIKLERWVLPLLPYVGACGLLVALAPRDRDARLIGLYALLSGLLGAVYFGGAGVSYNAVFDLVIASILGAALAVGAIAARASAWGLDGGWVRAAGVALLAVPLLVAAPQAFEQGRRIARARPLHAAIMAQDVAYVASHPGLAFCTSPAICYWAGKTFEIDLFNAHQKWASGILPWSQIEALLARHHWSVLQLPPSQDGRFSRLEQMALRHYDVARRYSHALFLVPRSKRGS